ncbi:hypothetical protein Droror1_Dr00028095 [Drosera rotundifolia]
MDSPSRSEAEICWEAQQEGWVALNTDGASRVADEAASAGGVFRNSEGAWIAGFALNLGYCSAMVAELQAIITGLEQAWSLGFRRVQLQTDSRALIEVSLKNLSLPKALARSSHHSFIIVSDLIQRKREYIRLIGKERRKVAISMC